MPSETLLPCPFCGSDPESYDDPVMADTWWVRCRECYCELSHEDEAQAVAAWNRRAAHQERDANDYPAWFAQLTRVTAVICWRCRSVEYIEHDYFALGKATCDDCGEKTYALPAVFRPKERDADARRLDWLERTAHRCRITGFGSDHDRLIVQVNGDPGATLRAAIDAAMAPDTQTEGESGD